MNWFATFRFGPVDEMLYESPCEIVKNKHSNKNSCRTFLVAEVATGFHAVQLKTAKTNFPSRRTSPQTDIKVARQKQNKGRWR